MMMDDNSYEGKDNINILVWTRHENTRHYAARNMGGINE